MNTIKPPVYNPSDIPQVALESMNKTHREEVDLINQLGEVLRESCKSEPDFSGITDKLHAWVRHTQDHFEGENKLMRDNSFPAYIFHSNEHMLVMEEIENLLQQWMENKKLERLSNFIFNEWPKWFNDHVNSMDMVTAEYLSKKIK